MRLDAHGVKELKEEIAHLDAKIMEIRKAIGDSIIVDGNTGIKNTAYLSHKSELDGAVYQKASLKKTLGEAILIKPHGQQDKVDIGDVVTLLDKTYGDTFDIRLMANYKRNLNAIPEEATIDSPLGEAIWGKGKGETAEYGVNGRKFSVEITDFHKMAVAKKEGKTSKPKKSKDLAD